MLDQITGMRAFSAAARLGGFSAAARTLGVSQTMVTKHVNALEERLGAKLLHRSTRRLSLTAQGRLYLEACDRILGEIDDLNVSITVAGAAARGLLRLTAPVSFGAGHLSPLLAGFARRYPAVKVELGLNDRLVDLIEEGWDLALRVGSIEAASATCRVLAPCNLTVCASPEYIDLAGAPETPQDLRSHNCLGYTLSSTVGADRWLFGAKGDLAIPVSGNLRANNGDALVAAALAGQGVIYQPRFLLAEHLKSGRLIPLLSGIPTVETLKFYLLTAPGQPLLAKTHAMIEFLTEALPSLDL